MTIQEFFIRIGWAYERSLRLIMDGNFDGLVLSDLGIVSGTLVVGIVFVRLVDGIMS